MNLNGAHAVVTGASSGIGEATATLLAARGAHVVLIARSQARLEVVAQHPDYVKIAWTLRADPAGPNASIFRNETRVTTTDRMARVKFRRYWSFFSPGIKLIRWLLLIPLRNEAERRAAEARPR